MMKALDYAEMGAKAIMQKFAPEELPPSHRFHYHQGVFLSGVEQLYKLTGKKEYFDYIKGWLDHNIDAEGNVPTEFIKEFDDIQPGILLFNMYEETGDERYKTALDILAKEINEFPVNSLGGVWHKYRNPNQMWLDCMYMMGVITTMYAVNFDRMDMVDKVYDLMKAMRRMQVNPANGLMYHMYDDSKSWDFIDKDTGLIPVHWGRAMGWFAVAMFEIAELLPEDHARRQEFIDAGKDLVAALLKYQDKEAGLWYQVVDKPDDERNWHETSCTALFTYAIAKAILIGEEEDGYREAVTKGYNGVLTKAEVKDGLVYLSGVCVGTGVGREDYYFTRETVTNDLHGMGAFLLMTTEVSKLGM